MTESRVENLLHQMSLKEPSAGLDEIVESVLKSEPPSAVAPVHQRLPWQLVSVVAAACLMVGVAVGRATVSPAAAGERPVVQSSDQTPSSDAENPNLFSADREEVYEETALDGPRVAILCSVKSRTAPGSEEKRCTKCHSGVTEGDLIADHGFVQRFHRQLCARCHDMNGVLEHWQLPKVDDGIIHEPWHEAVGKEAPTG